MTQPQATARGRGRALGPGLRRRGARARASSVHLGHPGQASPAPLGALDGSALGRRPRIRTATPWRPASRSERRHEARKPDPAGPARRRADRFAAATARRSCSWRARRAARDGRRATSLVSNSDHQRKDKAAGRQRRGRQARGAGRPEERLHRASRRSPRTRLQSVSEVAATRFDWERFMRELAHIMPEGSWMQSADASDDRRHAAHGGRQPRRPRPRRPPARRPQPAANLSAARRTRTTPRACWCGSASSTASRTCS